MITLSEYLGYIFIEITNARVMADHQSAIIAESYSKDLILQKFSVPRFKIPEMELSIPVVISGAKLSTTFSFKETLEQFKSTIINELEISYNKVYIKTKDSKSRNINLLSTIEASTNLTGQKTVFDGVGTIDTDIADFYEKLIKNANLDRPEEIITICFTAIFNSFFKDIKVPKDPFFNRRLLADALANIQTYVKDKTIISKSKIENLLVSPETNIINKEASDLSVFNIKAKITEEGIFVKTIRDEKGEKVISADVQFE